MLFVGPIKCTLIVDLINKKSFGSLSLFFNNYNTLLQQTLTAPAVTVNAVVVILLFLPGYYHKCVFHVYFF